LGDSDLRVGIRRESNGTTTWTVTLQGVEHLQAVKIAVCCCRVAGLGSIIIPSPIPFIQFQKTQFYSVPSIIIQFKFPHQFHVTTVNHKNYKINVHTWGDTACKAPYIQKTFLLRGKYIQHL